MDGYSWPPVRARLLRSKHRVALGGLDGLEGLIGESLDEDEVTS